MNSILELEIILWYACRGNDFPDCDLPVIREAIGKFVEHGILRHQPCGNPRYIADREAIDVYVGAVLSVPLPRKAWTIPVNQ